jgi:hypothetical protein
LLDLGQRCNQLFKTSDNLLKQKTLRVLLSNVELYNRSLSYTLNDPYKGFVEINKKGSAEPNSQLWCKSSGFLRTLEKAAVELEQDVLFQSLADTLQLDGQLLAA